MKRVMVTGCFDLLHSGHVAFLQEAATLGHLHVCIGSDATVFGLKGRYPVNSQDERRFMIAALRCTHDVRVNRGCGLIDFVEEMNEIKPDIFFVNEDGHSPIKQQLCAQRGIEYVVSRRVPADNLPVRSTTALRVECTIPYRIDLAGGWLDQPWVSQHHPGPVVTISIEPTQEFNLRSGMATSTRKRAIDLWRTAIPSGDPEKLARILFSFDNPPGTKEVAGSQDALGIVMPGLNKLNYQGQYWPASVQSVHDDATLDWLERHLYLITLGPRTSEFSVLAETHVSSDGAKMLSDAAEDCWQAILNRDIKSAGNAMRRSFEAQVAMFPLMSDAGIRQTIAEHCKQVTGYKLSGAGGGGYLIVLSETPIARASQIRIRRHGD